MGNKKFWEELNACILMTVSIYKVGLRLSETINV